MHALLILPAIVFVAGFALAAQAGVNVTLARGLGNPILAATTSFAGGLLLLAVLCLATRARLGEGATPDSLPWWAWLGGPLGVSFVVVNIFITPRLGVAAVLSLAVAGQLAGALVVDRFGLFGLVPRDISPFRILGVVLVLAGAVLVTRFR